MSDIGSRLQVARPVSPLSVDRYSDPHWLERERQQLFARGPQYVGHELAVPEVGDYSTLAHEDHGRALVRNADGIELVSNVCRHRQAIMLEGRGNAGRHVVCPLHRWTYDLKGELVGAPHFAQSPCLDLDRFAVRNWQGLLFEDKAQPALAEKLAELRGSKYARYFDFSGYLLDHVETHVCNYNWKTFIEVYLEDYHVGPFHPGLSRFVDCSNLEWEFGKRFSVQTVGLHESLRKPGSAVYAEWHDQCRRWFDQGRSLPDVGAVWLTIYPNIMVEWYPGVLCVSTLHPLSVDRTLNVVEFYYPEEAVLFERGFIEAERAAYLETAREDDEIGERMDRGRRALLARGVSESGPYQSPFEDGMQHFHEYLQHELKA
ncbi:aromatic ring-hydroxylating dioxygenase subunit alpha [soil metagenome]